VGVGQGGDKENLTSLSLSSDARYLLLNVSKEKDAEVRPASVPSLVPCLPPCLACHMLPGSHAPCLEWVMLRASKRRAHMRRDT
jgi:hypothetical protein